MRARESVIARSMPVAGLAARPHCVAYAWIMAHPALPKSP